MTIMNNYSKFSIELSFNNATDLKINETLDKCDKAINRLTNNTKNTYLFKKDNDYIYIVEVNKSNFSYRQESINKHFKNIDNDISIEVTSYNKDTLKDKLINLIKDNWIHYNIPKILT